MTHPDNYQDCLAALSDRAPFFYRLDNDDVIAAKGKNIRYIGKYACLQDALLHDARLWDLSFPQALPAEYAIRPPESLFLPAPADYTGDVCLWRYVDYDTGNMSPVDGGRGDGYIMNPQGGLRWASVAEVRDFLQSVSAQDRLYQEAVRVRFKYLICLPFN